MHAYTRVLSLLFTPIGSSQNEAVIFISSGKKDAGINKQLCKARVRRKQTGYTIVKRAGCAQTIKKHWMRVADIPEMLRNNVNRIKFICKQTVFELGDS